MRIHFLVCSWFADYRIYELTPDGTCTYASLERIITLPIDRALVMMGDAVPFDLLNPSNRNQPSRVVYTQPSQTPLLIYSHPLTEWSIEHCDDNTQACIVIWAKTTSGRWLWLAEPAARYRPSIAP